MGRLVLLVPREHTCLLGGDSCWVDSGSCCFYCHRHLVSSLKLCLLVEGIGPAPAAVYAVVAESLVKVRRESPLRFHSNARAKAAHKRARADWHINPEECPERLFPIPLLSLQRQSCRVPRDQPAPLLHPTTELQHRHLSKRIRRLELPARLEGHNTAVAANSLYLFFL